MSQYHKLVNLDKYECVSPELMGDSRKIWDQAGSLYGTATAAVLLLASSNKRGPRGSGDFAYYDDVIIGRWAGDRVCWVGDYAMDTDLPREDSASTIYWRCTMTQEEYLDVCKQRFERGDIKQAQFDREVALPIFKDITAELNLIIGREYELAIGEAPIERQKSLTIDHVITDGQILEMKHYAR